MEYKVLARKWRPQQFDDVVGQKHVTETLKNAIQSDRMAHAYLFVGPRGIGKTSIARILAKAMNCAKGATATPCDKCDSCKEIAEGRSMDVLEIDGASNNTVDQIRDLRDTVKFLPARDRFKIYIIDEVHMLTPQAFNALLKTLEEPPQHVKFIFATTEPQKILQTIVSRCQRFDLSRIPVNLIVTRLSDIAKAEKVAIDQDALLAVARGAEGGLRDAESALDQLISFKDDKITEEDVLSVFGLVSRQSLEEIVEAMLKGDVPRLMDRVAVVDQAGKDLQRLVIDLLAYFRNMLVCVYAANAADSLDILVSDAETLKRQAQLSSPERILKIADLLIEADGRLRYALSKRTLLEVSLIRCARTATVVSIDEILAQINKLKAALNPGGQASAGQRVAVPASATSITSATSSGEPVSSRRVKEAPLPVYAEKVIVKASAGEVATDEVGMLRGRWHALVEKVGKAAPYAKSALLDACPLSVSAKVVVLGFDPEFSEHMKRMEETRNLVATKNELKALLGRDVDVQLRLLKDGEKVAFPVDVPANGPGASSGKAVTGQSGSTAVPAGKPPSKKTPAAWMEDEAIRKAVEMFDGHIVEVRE